ncbi:(5-formylfuran-3-yl)methyl phosphate synthase [Gammaproteobacteria bacterium]|nr:(5-formylfuran-3-yl)methyl phosphate synthase [Gammaproteobacteria bacterium]
MSKILASIKDLSEAKILINTDIDIIDLKDPSNGALGRLKTNDIEIIVNFIAKKKLTSSTVGDLPNDEELISKNVKEVSSTNVDFIKIGVYENSYIKTLCNMKSCKKLIAVFFADKFLPTENEILDLKESDFSGIMLDTSNKKSGNLFNHVTYSQINNFLAIAKSMSLLTGIAGSINKTHIDDIIKLNPNYMGFRGALCENNASRSSNISTENVNDIVKLVRRYKNISTCD